MSSENKTEKRGKVIQGLNIPMDLAKKFKHKCVEDELSPRDIVGTLIERFCEGEFNDVFWALDMKQVERKYWGKE